MMALWLDRFARSPVRVMAPSFLLAICTGTGLLMLPWASQAGVGIRLVDALFTAVSATCVTGLVVLDTAAEFSRFGQTVILVLIQLGGLGVMTLSVMGLVLMGRRMDIGHGIALRDTFDTGSLEDVRPLLRFIVGMTLILEGAGALILAVRWWTPLGPGGTTVFHAVFHAVSAFCNAGFSTLPGGMTGFGDDEISQFIVAGLIIAGGLGFCVIRDLLGAVRRRFKSASPVGFKLQTRLALMVSAILIAAGMAGFMVMEQGTSWADWPFSQRLMAAFFQSVSARTAGFNTVDVGAMTPASQGMLMILMLIGASPGSTGGGIKTTTVAVLWMGLVASLKQRRDVTVHGRWIPELVIQKAQAVLVLALTGIGLGTLALLVVAPQDPWAALFEVVSAFGTVGLSMGLTPTLPAAGKCLVCVLMLVGRLGPLSLVLVLMRPPQSTSFSYAQEPVMIG